MANYSSRDYNNNATIPYPLAFLLDENLHALPYPEKEMYAYLKRRMNLSMQNRKYYEDEMGLFIYYKQAEIAEELHVSERQVRKTFHGMEEHGLIETKKQGMGLPQKIYIKNISDLSGTSSAGQSGTISTGQSGTISTGQSGTTSTGQSGTSSAGPYMNRDKRYRDKRYRDKRYREGGLIETFAGENENLLEALMAWVDMRKQIKSPLTDYAVKLALGKLQKLSGGDERLMVEIINQTIENGWKSFFPLKNASYTGVKKSRGQAVFESLEELDAGTEKSVSNFG